MPGPSPGAVRAFLHRETNRPDTLRRVARVAPNLYWRANEANRINGKLYLPSTDRIGDAFAGPHASAVSWLGAHRAGWRPDHCAVRFAPLPKSI